MKKRRISPLAFLLPAALVVSPALLLLDRPGRVLAIVMIALLGLSPALLAFWNRHALPDVDEAAPPEDAPSASHG